MPKGLVRQAEYYSSVFEVRPLGGVKFAKYHIMWYFIFMLRPVIPVGTERTVEGADNVDHKDVGRYDFSDGSTVFEVKQGRLLRGYVVINPDHSPQHPPTNEQPFVRRMMRELFHVAATHVFDTGRLPEDVTFDDVFKGDHYNDYAQITRFLMREGLLHDDHLAGSAYE